jgi:peptidoglycan hydrolase CwlO-like protein
MPKSVRALHNAIDAQVKRNAEAIAKIGDGIKKIREDIRKLQLGIRKAKEDIRSYAKNFWYG